MKKWWYMVNVDIDKELYDSIKGIVKTRKYHYPSIKFFVQKAVYNELVNAKSFPEYNFDDIYSRLKELLERHPELKSKIEKIHTSELKKIKKDA